MKRIFYHMACWLAVLGCAACSNETDFVQPEADNNSIVLDISSATTSVTRAGATGAEVTVSYVDVLIFDDTDNKSLAHYERVQVVADSQKSGKITLAKAQRKDFKANESYWVYLIANSTAFILTAHDFPPPLAPPYIIILLCAVKNCSCFGFVRDRSNFRLFCIFHHVLWHFNFNRRIFSRLSLC